MEEWLKKYYEDALDYWNTLNKTTGTIADVEDIYKTMVDFVAQDTGYTWVEAEKMVFDALDDDERAMFDLIDDDIEV